jgi:hypothetical protein
MSAEQSGQSNEPDEPWLSREELVEKEHQARLRRCAELQRRIDERCREAEAKWRAREGGSSELKFGSIQERRSKSHDIPGRTKKSRI